MGGDLTEPLARHIDRLRGRRRRRPLVRLLLQGDRGPDSSGGHATGVDSGHRPRTVTRGALTTDLRPPIRAGRPSFRPGVRRMMY